MNPAPPVTNTGLSLKQLSMSFEETVHFFYNPVLFASGQLEVARESEEATTAIFCDRQASPATP